MTAPADVKEFHKYAFAIPRTTTLSFKYDKAAGEVKQTWKVDTEALKGDEKQTVMGWIPHHYRTTVMSVPFASYEYPTVRGKMKTTIANSVDITYKFTGILPILPAPVKSGGPHDFNPEQMKTYLTAYGGFNDFRDATYWGGKDVLQTAWAMTEAKLLERPFLRRRQGAPEGGPHGLVYLRPGRSRQEVLLLLPELQGAGRLARGVLDLSVHRSSLPLRLFHDGLRAARPRGPAVAEGFWPNGPAGRQGICQLGPQRQDVPLLPHVG